MKVEEIRQELIKYGYTEEEANSIKGKSNLIEELENVVKSQEDAFSSLETSSTQDEIEEKYEFGSKEWNDYLISQCTEDELYEKKYPCVAALRRLVNKIIGKIVGSGVRDFNVSSDPEIVGKATVVYQVDVLTYDGQSLSYSDIADCWRGNAGAVFAVHPSAMASSRAEGRCLRKILGLTVNTFEEMDNPNNPVEVIESSSTKREADDFESQSATQTQKVLINNKCESLNIDLLKFIQNNFNTKYVSLEQMNREDAHHLVKLINDYQSGTNIPEEIKK